MYTSQRSTPLVSSTTRRRFREVQIILATHSIEIRLLESGRVLLWHAGPFGNPEPREYDNLLSVVDEQLPLTKDDRLHAYTGDPIVAVKLVTVFSGNHISKFYPVILEGYRIVKRSGSKRRKYEGAFTEKERAWIKKEVETTWHRWNFVTGVPQEVKMENLNYILMMEAANFFATI